MRDLTYKDFSTDAEIATFKRLKARQKNLGDATRTVLCELTGGKIGDGTRSRKQFLTTRKGKFRVAVQDNSDNSTEVAAHRRMGVQVIQSGSRDEVLAFLKKHGVQLSWLAYLRAVGRELRRMDP